MRKVGSKVSARHAEGKLQIRRAVETAVRGPSKRARGALHSSWQLHVEILESRLLLSAYALNQLASFEVNGSGANPRSTLVADSSGNLYGTASAGGAYGHGTVFEIAHGSNALTTLASFNGTDGSDPMAGLLLDQSGDLYGTADQGGSSNDGTVFEIAAGSGAITALASFNGTDGENPQCVPTSDSLGDIYGTAAFGGPHGDGTVFEIASGSTSITTLISFNGTNGANPYAGLTLDPLGNLYGTTYAGGTDQSGTIFEIPNGSTTLTTLYSFLYGIYGFDIGAGIAIDASDNLYGVAEIGGTDPSGGGLVFELPHGSAILTTLASFDGTDGQYSSGTLVLDPSGNLYGTTSYGGPDYVKGDFSSGYGTVFEIASGSNTITTLASFNYSDGYLAEAGLTLDAFGDLIGMTFQGGANDDGTVFEVANGYGSITDIASFDSVSGTPENSSVTLDASGDLFGETEAGGPTNEGTVFELANGSSMITTVASFDRASLGWYPSGGLTADADGDLFGTTDQAGPNNDGTVFEIAAGSNVITILAGARGLNTKGGVTLDAAGNLYWSYGDGVFEIANGSNATTTLATFNSNVGPAQSSLAIDLSGNLYGTTSGSLLEATNGVLFELAKGSGMITYLANVGTNSTANGVTLDAAGNLYCLTETGGKDGEGSVFEIPRGSSAITTIASFDGANGSLPQRNLTVDPAGNLYGMTASGGANGDGTIFEIAKGSATITTLVSFNGTNGADPNTALTLNSVGDFIGTTEKGGVSGYGTIFELVPNTTVTLVPNSLSKTTGPLSFTAAVSGGVPDGETVSLVDESANDAVVATGTLSDGSATLTVPAGALPAGVHNLIAVYGGDANFAPSESTPISQTVVALPAYITPSSNATYTYNPSTAAVTLTSGTLTFTADNTTAPLINLTASGPASGVFFDTSEHLAGLTLSGGAQATVMSLGSARTHSNHNVLVIGTLSATSDPAFSIDSQSKLDLLDNDLIVHTGSSDAGGASAYASVAALAAEGRNPASGAPGQPDGQWNGNGLSSSAAASADASAGYEQIGLAVVVNSSLLTGAFSSWQVGSFNEPLGANDIIVKYDYLGDYALEGQVSADDAGILQLEYDNGSSNDHTWATGSSLFDGLSDNTEAGLFQLQYGLGTGGNDGAQL